MANPNPLFGALRRVIVTAPLALLFACSSTQSPAPPSSISIVSGDLQYSRRGAPLPEPLVVRVLTDAGDVPLGASVVFSVVQGGGELSAPIVPVGNRGLASVTYTLGPDLGAEIIRAAIQENPSRSVDFVETSANFSCPEQEDTLRVRYRTAHHLFLATRKSSLYPAVGSGGVVEVNIYPPQTTSGFAEIVGAGGGIFDTNIFDAAFSPRGDFYVARRSLTSEILKIDPAGNVSLFARLPQDLPPTEIYAEITMNPSGLLVGCDVTGPFVVGCRDTLHRFEEATFTGGINNDAVAVDPRRQSEDPLGEDIYFINKSASALMRLAMDSLAVEPRGLETVASLSKDRADHARGMVCEPRDGHVFILVDSDNAKELLEVTPGGAVTVLYDFFDRGDGSAAGMQRDLAYDDDFRFLYTLDTLNDNVLLFDLNQQLLVPLFDDPVLQSTLSNRGSGGALDGGERVGLVVLK